ncbi:MAG: hypothetical protein GX879_02115 [Bacteroidales bacterium]|nr:hypothetical protein [Bacteroidales bacterium]
MKTIKQSLSQQEKGFYLKAFMLFAFMILAQVGFSQNFIRFNNDVDSKQMLSSSNSEIVNKRFHNLYYNNHSTYYFDNKFDSHSQSMPVVGVIKADVLPKLLERNSLHESIELLIIELEPSMVYSSVNVSKLTAFENLEYIIIKSSDSMNSNLAKSIVVNDDKERALKFFYVIDIAE